MLPVMRAYAASATILEARIDRLTAKIDAMRANGETVNVGTVFALDQAKELLRIARVEGDRMAAALGEGIGAEAERIARQADADARDIVNGQMGPVPDGAVALDWVGINTGAVQAIVATTEQGPLRAILDTFGTEAARDMADILTTGVALGRGALVIGRDLKNATAISAARAKTIARTETNRVYRASSQAAMRANANILTGWMWRAKTSTCCVACLIMHGTLHPVEETMTSHPNCRCAPVPKPKTWEELGYNVSNRYQINFTITPGAQYFENLSDPDKLARLGPSRYAAYKAGDVAFVDFLTEPESEDWGRSRSVASINAAKANAGKPFKYAYARPYTPPIAKGNNTPPPPPPSPSTPPAPHSTPQNPRRYEYPTADEALHPEMLAARRAIEAGEDPAQFADVARRDMLRRVGYDEDRKKVWKAKVAELKPINKAARAARESCRNGDRAACAERDRLEAEVTRLTRERDALDPNAWFASGAVPQTRPDVVRTTLRDLRPDFGRGDGRLQLSGDPEVVDILNQQSENFPRDVWNSVVSDLNAQGYEARREDRGYFWVARKEIVIGRREARRDNDTATHELWHAAEVFGDERIVESEQAFLRRRIAPGEKQETIYAGRNEVAYRDNFLEHYMGKDYAGTIEDGREPQQGDAFEVGTMAMGRMFGGPCEYQYQDPDYANWVIGLLLEL